MYVSKLDIAGMCYQLIYAFCYLIFDFFGISGRGLFFFFFFSFNSCETWNYPNIRAPIRYSMIRSCISIQSDGNKEASTIVLTLKASPVIYWSLFPLNRNVTIGNKTRPIRSEIKKNFTTKIGLQLFGYLRHRHIIFAKQFDIVIV